MKACKSLRIEENVIKGVQDMARKQNRSFNNMVEVVLKAWIEEEKKRTA